MNAQLRPRDPMDALSADLAACVRFLIEIGLSVSVVDDVGTRTFSPGIRIRGGSLEIDPTAQPSSLLHEAGHLATMPTRFRPLMDGNLYRSLQLIEQQLEALNLDPDHPLMRAMVQCSDTEATAWAWAAGIHLGLPHEVIVRDEDYSGDGESIRTMLAMNSYFGINGMVWAGMCINPRRPGGYPRMLTWLQSADIEAAA